MTERTIETPRLLLSHWTEEDAEEEYELAKDPYIGKMCGGWPAPEDPDSARETIRSVLMKEECYRIRLKENAVLVGCCELMRASRHGQPEDYEIGYWIGRPFWGNGYAGEAVNALLRRAFLELDADRVWCSCYDGNDQSRRVIEKCGFSYHHTNENLFSGKLNARNYNDLVYLMTWNDWESINREEDRSRLPQ